MQTLTSGTVDAFRSTGAGIQLAREVDRDEVARARMIAQCFLGWGLEQRGRLMGEKEILIS